MEQAPKNEPIMCTSQELHDRTAEIIEQMHDENRPVLVTRLGRFVARIEPVPDGIEGRVVSEWLKTLPQDEQDQMRGRKPLEGALSLEEAAKKLGIEDLLPPQPE